MPAKASEILNRQAWSSSHKCFSKQYNSDAYRSLLSRSTIINMSFYIVKFLRCFFGICVTCYSLVRFVDCNPDSENCYSPSGADCDWYTGTVDALRPDSNSAVRRRTFRDNSVAYGRQTATPCPRHIVMWAGFRLCVILIADRDGRIF